MQANLTKSNQKDFGHIWPVSLQISLCFISFQGTGCSFFYPLPGQQCITDPLVTIKDITLRNVNIYGGILSPGIIGCNSTNPCSNFLFVNVYNKSTFPVEKGYLCENVMGQAKNSNLVPDCFKNLSDDNI